MPCQPGALWTTRDTKGREAHALGLAHYMNLLKHIDSPLNKGEEGHFDLEPGSVPLRIMPLDELYDIFPGTYSSLFYVPILTSMQIFLRIPSPPL